MDIRKRERKKIKVWLRPLTHQMQIGGLTVLLKWMEGKEGNAVGVSVGCQFSMLGEACVNMELLYPNDLMLPFTLVVFLPQRNATHSVPSQAGSRQAVLGFVSILGASVSPVCWRILDFIDVQ